MTGKFMKTRKFPNGKAYTYYYPNYSALSRCRRLLRKPGMALVPAGSFGRWVGPGDVLFQNRTVQALIKGGYAKIDDNGAVRKVR